MHFECHSPIRRQGGPNFSIYILLVWFRSVSSVHLIIFQSCSRYSNLAERERLFFVRWCGKVISTILPPSNSVHHSLSTKDFLCGNIEFRFEKNASLHRASKWAAIEILQSFQLWQHKTDNWHSGNITSLGRFSLVKNVEACCGPICQDFRH